MNTIRPFKHLKLDRVITNGQVTGFVVEMEAFNNVVFNGAKQQKRKKCVSTQYDIADLKPRPISPSVFAGCVNYPVIQ